jgi:tRNA threonylcarbamoyladenosine biosynthesis protein TsaB
MGRPPSGLLAAIDTSTDQAGLALYDGRLVAELSWPSGRHGSRTVLPNLQRLLDLAGGGPERLGAVAVALGPGSFTALRVGLSVAKGLAYALRCPIIGIPTLDVVAYPHQQAGRTVWAVVSGGRARVVAAPYATTEGGWRAVAPPWHGPADDLLARLSGPTLLAGDLPPALADAAGTMDAIRVAPPALRGRRAGALAELAWRRWQVGDTDDLVGLEPLYMHGATGTAPA